jgi:membrane-associated protease RseP (regulator of RpoE activity)
VTRGVVAVAFVVAVAAVAVARTAPEARARPPGASGRPETVPVTLLRTGHLMMHVRIDGRGPYAMLLDTGSPITVVDEKTAREVGAYSGDGQGPLFNLMGPGVTVRLPSVTIGAATVPDVVAYVMDHPGLGRLASETRGLAGIVGASLFGRFSMTLDYQVRSATFRPNGFVPPNVLDRLPILLRARASGAAAPRVLAPAAVWGMVVSRSATDAGPGVLVTRVLDGGAAATAGLRAGDRLVELDGRWTDSVADCLAAAEAAEPAIETSAVVVRRGRRVTLTATPRAGF